MRLEMDGAVSAITTEEELLAKLEALGPMTEQQRNQVVCALIGHSRIQTYSWGLYCCARCGTPLGDVLAGFYPEAEQAVVVGHGDDCPVCRQNYKECTWKDKIFAPDPFTHDRQQ